MRVRQSEHRSLGRARGSFADLARVHGTAYAHHITRRRGERYRSKPPPTCAQGLRKEERRRFWSGSSSGSPQHHPRTSLSPGRDLDEIQTTDQRLARASNLGARERHALTDQMFCNDPTFLLTRRQSQFQKHTQQNIGSRNYHLRLT